MDKRSINYLHNTHKYITVHKINNNSYKFQYKNCHNKWFITKNNFSLLVVEPHNISHSLRLYIDYYRLEYNHI